MATFAQHARKIATECAGMRVRQVSRVLTRIYDEALRGTGIQSSQLSVLVAVAMFGEAGAPMGVLADKLVMDRTTLTRNIGPLEEAGYLRVARSPSDARTRVVLLTRAGERMLDTAYPRWEEAQRRIKRALGGERFEGLRAHLSGVVELAETLEADAAS